MTPQIVPHTASLKPATLVFPATHPDGLKYIQSAIERDEHIIAATSESHVQVFAENVELHVLPYVYDVAFSDVFLQFINKNNIARIYAPVSAVHSWLSRFIHAYNLNIHLIGLSPIKREIARFDELMTKVSSYRTYIDSCAGQKSDLSDLEIASIFRMSSNIYGESNEQKIAGIIAIFNSAPKGDVIEIGSLAGKSASVLTLLAKRYQIGNILAIDPWNSSASVQLDSPETVRVHMVGEWEFEMLPKNFVINMMPIGLGNFNYLREESIHGCEIYRKSLSVTTDVFGKIDYAGKIAVIHIDGNHDYEKVKMDCDLWIPMLSDYSWLILDDYIWTHGDGPHRVGDQLLERFADCIDTSFVCGKALFIKFTTIGRCSNTF